jgi:hypothetical protein
MSVAPPDSAPAMGLYVTDPWTPFQPPRALRTLFPERTSPRALTLIHPHIRRESG